MNIYSHGINLGYFIDQIDFSRNDVKEQFATLAESDEEARQFLSLLEKYGEEKPFAAFGLVVNAAVCTYYVKDDIVLGKARGFGYLFDHYHNAATDKGQVYLQTLVQTNEIPEEDRALSFTYTPSSDLGVGSGGTIDLELYNREVAGKQVEVNGYWCDVATYTLASGNVPAPTPDETNPLPTASISKLVVYAAKGFNKTINFTHPFYLPEDAGILKLEIYYDGDTEPTLVMQPDEITSRPVANDELQIREVLPMYTIDDAALAWKVLPIMFSGWGVLGQE